MTTISRIIRLQEELEAIKQEIINQNSGKTTAELPEIEIIEFKNHTYYPINTVGTLLGIKCIVTEVSPNESCKTCILANESCMNISCTPTRRRDNKAIMFKAL